MNEESKPLIQNEYGNERENQETGKKTLNSFALTNGVYLGVILIIFSLIGYVADFSTTSWINYLSYVMVIGMLIYALKTYRDKESGGFISYGRSLGLGTLVGLYSSILLAIYTFVFFQYFDPAELQKILVEAENNMLDQGMSDRDVDTAMGFTRMMTNPPVMAAFTVIGFTFWSFIFSLIISIFVKKDNPDLIFNE